MKPAKWRRPEKKNSGRPEKKRTKEKLDGEVNVKYKGGRRSIRGLGSVEQTWRPKEWRCSVEGKLSPRALGGC